MTSARYHRPKHPRKVRYFNWGNQQSTPTIQRPFGTLPNQIANQDYRQTIKPFLGQLGYGQGQGPEAGLLSFLSGGPGAGPQGGFLGGLYPGLQQIGQDAASTGTAAFNQYQGQVDQFLNQIPGLENQAQQGGMGAQQAGNYANQFAQQAFDPTSQNQLYQQSAQRLLQTMRPGEAARGMQMQGGASDAESQALQNLSFGQAQQQQGNQTQAIQNQIAASGQLGQNAMLQAALGQAGPGALQGLLQQIPGLSQLQAGQYAMPFQGIQDYLGLLGFGQQGAGNVLGVTAPQIANQSTGFNFGFL